MPSNSALLVLLLSLPFAGSVVAAFLPTNARNVEAWWAALIALVALTASLLLYPAVTAGGIVKLVVPWIPSFGLDFTLRLDGFAWLFTTLVTAPALPFVMTGHDASDWLLLLGIGLAGALGQLLLTAALRFGTVASVIVMDYSGLFWATLYGWLLFGMLPPATTWFGAPLIVIAGLVIAWREHRLARPGLRDVARAEGT